MMLYLLKVNLILAVFYSFYRLLFARDTFFTLRRAVLLSSYGLAFVLPLLSLRLSVSVPAQMGLLSDSFVERMLPAVVVRSADGGMSVGMALGAVYVLVAGVLLLRMAVQCVAIVRLARRTSTRVIDGVRVHLLPAGGSPFSFFGWIFVSAEGQDRGQLAEILLHERTHVRQWHSLDVVLSQAVNALCWLNPFAWLTAREVRLNLEYLADEQVLSAGNDRRAYQYHLLALSYTSSMAIISNHFNVLPLKLRIRMMKKERTCGLLRAKYLLMVPVTAMMLVACHAGNPSDKKAQTGRDTTTANKAPDAAAAETSLSAAASSAAKGNVYEIAEQMPTYPGGQAALMNYLYENINYPAEAVAKKVQGRVVVAFVIDKNGRVQKPEVVRSVDPLLDREALRVVGGMPAWNPGKQKGKAVNVRYNLPIAFRLK